MPHFKVKLPFDFAGAIKVMRANNNINIVKVSCHHFGTRWRTLFFDNAKKWAAYLWIVVWKCKEQEIVVIDFFVSLINGANFVGSKYENIIIDMVSESVSILKDFLWSNQDSCRTHS